MVGSELYISGEGGRWAGNTNTSSGNVDALGSTAVHEARPVFERVFREVGVPEQILTDNGVPFCAPTALQGLSALSVWWLKLGIRHLRIEPGAPVLGLFKDARLALIEGAAHWVHHDKYEEFVERVSAFFDAVPLRA